MKRIYIYLLAAIASLAFAQMASAQTIEETIPGVTFPNELTTDYTISNNVGVRKQVSSPLSDGTYWIKLEAFATGHASISTISKPADIILVLDYSSSMTATYGSTTRIAALKSACRAFLKTIYDNDKAARDLDNTYAGDRVAIVSFSSSATTRYSLRQINTNYSTLDSYFSGNNISTSQGTDSAEGLELAMEQWQSGGAATTDPDRSRAVVLFTDGCPSTHGSYTFDCDIAGGAVNNANTLKHSYGASVYTVGLFDTTHTSWTNSSYVDWRNDVLDYMNFVSSNFDNVTATYTVPSSWSGNSNSVLIRGTITYTIDNGSTTLATARASDNYADATEAAAGGAGGYFFMASDNPSSLNAIFESIANQTGGAANTELTAASTTTVDVVSASFLLPTNADENSIKVFTAKCNYANPDTHVYTFDQEILAPYSDDKYRIYSSSTEYTEKDVDVDINVDLDKPNNKISVDGFDYANNWCGPVTSGSLVTYQGHKVIILIPIKANPDAVGGPNVKTNTSDSGIYVDGSPLISFEYPTISLPVNIYIEKEGLKNGESAKFIIEKAILPASGNVSEIADNAWSYVTSVFVTKPQGSAASAPNPVVKVKGLPPVDADNNGLVYRIREEGWSWSYTYSADPKYTVSGQSNNPFLFTNTPKTNIDIRVRHAESKATNVFKTGETGGHYDDSKTNTRP